VLADAGRLENIRRVVLSISFRNNTIRDVFLFRKQTFRAAHVKCRRLQKQKPELRYYPESYVYMYARIKLNRYSEHRNHLGDTFNNTSIYTYRKIIVFEARYRK